MVVDDNSEVWDSEGRWKFGGGGRLVMGERERDQGGMVMVENQVG